MEHTLTRRLLQSRQALDLPAMPTMVKGLCTDECCWLVMQSAS